METYERIKELRKNYLNMSQAAFGERLGVNRDVINNIENNRLAKPEQKLSLIKLMCKEFNVNEEWLLNGTEPMIVEPDTFSLDDFVAAHGMTDLELEIVKTYFELDPDIRSLLWDHFKKVFVHHENDGDNVPDNPEELERQFPPVEDSDSEVG